VFDTIFGLPMHPLVVHATVVIVPAAALAVALAAGWPRFRRWAGFLPLLLSAAAVVLVPISTSSGESLERRVGHSAAVERHVHLADGLLLPVLILAVAAAALYWIQLKGQPGLAVLGAVLLIAAVGSVGTLVQVARIGHSGAEAAWSGVGSSSPPPAAQAGDH
jgi:hypothetical protein